MKATAQDNRGEGVESQGNRASYRDLLSTLLSQTANLVRGEIALAKAELRDKLRARMSGAVMTVFGFAVGLLSAMSLAAAAIVALSPKIGPVSACVFVGGVLGAVAIFLVMQGLRQLGK